MPLVITPDRQYINLEGEELAAALAAGAVLAGVAGRNEFGRETVSGLEELSTVYEPIARSAAKRYEDRMGSYEDENLQAFGEGVGRGVSAGLVFNGEEEQDRARVNPIVSTAGEAAGIVGGALTGVGAGGVAARAGTAAAGRLGLSGVASLAVEGAVDGAVYATMQQASEYIQNRPIDAEAILLAGLTGGIIGGAAGAAAKGFASGRKAFEGLSEARAKPTAFDDALPPEPSVLKPKKKHWTDDITDQPAADAEDFNPFKMASPEEIKAVRGFVSDMPQMRVANSQARMQFDSIEAIDSELAKIGSENMVFIEDDLLPKWNALQKERRDWAREMKWKPRSEEVIAQTGKSLNQRYTPPDDFWQGIYVASPERRLRLLNKWEEIVSRADDIQESLNKLKFADNAPRQDVWVYGPKSKPTANALRGATPDGLGGMRFDPAAAGVNRSHWIQENLGTKATAYSDDISEFMRHAKPDANYQFALSDATTPVEIMGDLVRGKDITIGQFLSLSTAKRRGVISSLSDEAKGRLGTLWKSDPELVSVPLTSKPVEQVDYSALRRELRESMGEAEGDAFFSQFEAETAAKKAKPPISASQPPTWKDDITNVLGTLVRFKLGLPQLASLMAAGEKLLPFIGQASSAVSKVHAGKRLNISGTIGVLMNGPLRPDRFLAESNAQAGLQATLVDTLDISGMPEGAQAPLRAQFGAQTSYLRGIAPKSLDPYEATYAATHMRRWEEALTCWRYPVQVLGRGATIVELQHIKQMWPAIYREFYAGIQSKQRVQVGTNKQMLAIVNSNQAMREGDTKENVEPAMKKPGASQLSQKVINVLAPQSDSERMTGPR